MLGDASEVWDEHGRLSHLRGTHVDQVSEALFLAVLAQENVGVAIDSGVPELVARAHICDFDSRNLLFYGSLRDFFYGSLRFRRRGSAIAIAERCDLYEGLQLLYGSLGFRRRTSAISLAEVCDFLIKIADSVSQTRACFKDLSDLCKFLCCTFTKESFIF